MAVSTTTFEQRLARINKGQTVDVAAQVGRSSAAKARVKARIMTFPFLVGVGILTGGTAYAWASVQPEMQWVVALAG
ncbi:MAG: hypothetical protein AAF307_04220 [Pseudomonadota bacterium]